MKIIPQHVSSRTQLQTNSYSAKPEFNKLKWILKVFVFEHKCWKKNNIDNDGHNIIEGVNDDIGNNDDEGDIGDDREIYLGTPPSLNRLHQV